MARKSERKLFLFGRYSLALLLPKKWLTEIGAKRSDTVEMEYDRARGRIVLRFVNNSNATTEPAAQVTKTTQTKTPKTDAAGLQPIPEL